MYIENFKFPTTIRISLTAFFKVFPGNCITKHFLPQTFSPLFTYKKQPHKDTDNSQCICPLMQV